MGHTNIGRLELASIIVPCWNQLEFTRQCMAALMRCTRSAWELIVVNNGSTDGTNDYLAGVQDASAVPVTMIANSTNLGFPAAVNQGLKHARGEYLVLLINDAVATEGWLEQLIARRRPGRARSRGSSALTVVAREPAPLARRLCPTLRRLVPPGPAPRLHPPLECLGARRPGPPGSPAALRRLVRRDRHWPPLTPHILWGPLPEGGEERESRLPGVLRRTLGLRDQ